MYDTQKNSTGLMVFFFDVVFAKLYQRRVTGSIALYENASCFIDGKQMVVFIDDFKRFLPVHPEDQSLNSEVK